MKEQLVTKETAILAKSKGFQELCLYYYINDKLYQSHLENGSSTDTDFRVEVEDLYENYNDRYKDKSLISAPTQSLLQKWLRDIYNLHPVLIPYFGSEYNDTGIEAWELQNIKNLKTEQNYPLQFRYDNYEDALEAGLQRALSLIA